jgi:uncharacterized peroxidase-related enzyme
MFLDDPPRDEAVNRIYDDVVEESGYLSNYAKAWAWRPDIWRAFTDARSLATRDIGLNSRELAVLISAAVSGAADSYCSLAWGTTLSRESDEQVAAGVVSGQLPEELGRREVALVNWARQVTRDPLATTAEDAEELRAAGFTDREVFGITALIAFRVAFSSINAAVGSQPDLQLSEAAPPQVREAAVAFGRPVASEPSPDL